MKKTILFFPALFVIFQGSYFFYVMISNLKYFDFGAAFLNTSYILNILCAIAAICAGVVLLLGKKWGLVFYWFIALVSIFLLLVGRYILFGEYWVVALNLIFVAYLTFNKKIFV